MALGNSGIAILPYEAVKSHEVLNTLAGNGLGTG